VARLGPTFELAASEQTIAKLEREIQRAPRKAHKTALRVLRRTLKRGKSRMSFDVREKLNLKKTVVDQRINTKEISQQSLVGSVSLRDRRIELIEFMTKSQIATSWRRQNTRIRRSPGVAVKVYKDKGRELYAGTFVNLGKRDLKWHVLEREGPERYPIYIKYGPNMATEFLKELPRHAEDNAAWMEAEMQRLLLKNVDIT